MVCQRAIHHIKDLALEAAIAQRGLPKSFETKNKLDVLRAAKISKEMGLNFAVKASGQEYEILDELKAAKGHTHSTP